MAMRAITRSARAVAEALFARDQGPPPAERLDWLCRDFEDFLEHAGPRSEAVLSASLAVATWLAPLTIRRRPPLSRLSLHDRCEALEATEDTMAGLAILAVKAILSILYYEHPDSQAEIGVDSSCLNSEPEGRAS